MTIYQIEELLESIGYKDYTPQHIPAEWIQARPEYHLPDNAVLKGWGGNHGMYKRGSEHHLYGTQRPDVGKKISAAKQGRSYPACSRKGNPNWDGVQEMAAAASRKKVVVNNIIYNSCSEAAKAVGVTPGTFTYWLKKGKAEYYHG